MPQIRHEALATGAERLLAFGLLAVVLAIAVSERYDEPAASPVIVAEDPLTHLVFTKEHLARGYFADSFHLGTILYPPGLHAYLGSLWSLSGLDLYTLGVWLPLAFATLGIATTFLLGWRFGGPAAGFVAALLLAILPEVIFRGTLFSPTVLDLALLPVLAWTLAEAMDGRRAAVAGALASGLALSLAHPWIVSIAAAAGIGVLVLHHQLAPKGIDEAVAAPGRAWAAFALAVLVGTAWLIEASQDQDKGVAGANVLIAGVAAGLGLLFALEARNGWRIPRAGALLSRWWVALLLGVVLAVLAWMAFQVIVAGPLPTNVDYGLMLGPAAAWAAFGGLALLFVARNAVAYWGASLTVLLFPFTAADLLNLWYLPHRSVVFLAIGIALLGGAAAQTIVDAAGARLAARRPAAGRWVAVGSTLALVLALTPVAESATPDDPYTWYRLFTDDEFGGLEFAAARTHESPVARVMTMSWQANAFEKALAEPDQVVYDPDFFRGGTRETWKKWSTAGHLYAVLDGYAQKEVGDPFAGAERFELAWSNPSGTMKVYRWTA